MEEKVNSMDSKYESKSSESLPEFNSKERKCLMCGITMFYSKENLVHVCLEESHGVLCFFEPDECWFAASEATAETIAKKGVKFHFIPKEVFENAGLKDFRCEYNSKDSQ